MNHQGNPPAKGELHGNPRLEKITEKDRITPFFAKDTQGIGGTDVAAALRPEIDTADATGQISEGNRSKQVGANGNQKPGSYGIHAP